MGKCIWNCLKYHLGFWGAIAVLGLLLAAIAAIGISTGGAGIVTLAAILETVLGSAGITLFCIGGSGIFGALVACIARCW
ncbi:MAG: hypothetical protein KAX28_13270 [Candidatus Marinimicrobia bacterium]|nr:hypothetical protein [Candidatus Neomarinimicrobiota bacterium]